MMNTIEEIEVTKKTGEHGPIFEARVPGTDLCASGRSADEAVGCLIRCHSGTFDIEINMNY